MLMIEIGEDEEVLYPDELEEEEMIPLVLPATKPAQVPHEVGIERPLVAPPAWH